MLFICMHKCGGSMKLCQRPLNVENVLINFSSVNLVKKIHVLLCVSVCACACACIYWLHCACGFMNTFSIFKSKLYANI